MEKYKLERDQQHTINANPSDELHLWPSLFHNDRHNLTLRDHWGRELITVYSLTCDQLAQLYVEIGEILGKPADPTNHQTKQLLESIFSLINNSGLNLTHKPKPPDAFANE